jgi:hypothetical protein
MIQPECAKRHTAIGTGPEALRYCAADRLPRRAVRRVGQAGEGNQEELGKTGQELISEVVTVCDHLLRC